MANNYKGLKKSLVYQQDVKDCGVACLLTAIKFHGYHSSLERLRELSGTNDTGTSLYGLKQAANQVGFESEAFYAENTQELLDHEGLMILHVVKNDKYEHFLLVCPDKSQNSFIIADPDGKVLKMSPSELSEIWFSKALLSLKRTDELKLPKQDNHKVLDWLKPILIAHQNKLLIIIVLGLFSAILAFSTAIFTEKLVDDLLPTRNSSLVIKGILVWSLLLFSSIGLGVLHRVAIMKFSIKFNTDITHHFFEKLLFLPKVFFRSKKTGDLITRMEDIEEIEGGVISWIESGIVSTLIILFSIILLFTYDLQLATINTFFLPSLFITTLWLRSQIIQAQRKAMVAHGLSNANYVDVITGIDAIKAQHLEKKFTRLAVDFYYLFRKRIFDSEMTGLKFGTVIQVITFLNTVLIISLSSLKVLQGSLEIGNMFAIISILLL